MKTKNIQEQRGFTLVEIMIVVALIGMLTAVAIPNFMKSRTAAQRNACIKNISVIESAKQQWGLEKGKTDGDIPVEADLVGPLLYLKQMPTCPGGGTYTLGGIGGNAICSNSSLGHSL